jgi:hypothetical protein
VTISAIHGGPGWVTLIIGVVVLVALGLSRALPPDSLTRKALISLLQGVGPFRSDEETVPRYVIIGLVVTSVAMIVLGIALLATGH